MIRKIIKIDEELCNGCGLCAGACHEGAIEIVDGKAKLIRDDYCDGLGNCLPACPTGAIRFEEREAAAYDEEAVLERQAQAAEHAHACSCPGSAAHSVAHHNLAKEAPAPSMDSELRQWPVQIKLINPQASYLNNSHLLVAADCTAYAYGGFHSKFMRNKITLIGCPKLDDEDYSEKLTEILKRNEIKSVTVVRMEVPCCGGIVYAVTEAIRNSGKMIPWSVVTIGVDGDIIED